MSCSLDGNLWSSSMLILDVLRLGELAVAGSVIIMPICSYFSFNSCGEDILSWLFFLFGVFTTFLGDFIIFFSFCLGGECEHFLAYCLLQVLVSCLYRSSEITLCFFTF